jgi:uncharacterized protein (TIGR00106 family)
MIKEEKMKVILDLCVVPLGVGVSVSTYVAACQEILRSRGVKHQLHAYGTNIEGEWDEVMEAVKQCHLKVHDMGAPRITTTIKLGTRTDRSQSMEDKVASVIAKAS